MLKIRGLSATVGTSRSCRVSTSRPRRRSARCHGAERLWEIDARLRARGREGYEVTGGSASLDGHDLLAMDPGGRAAAGLSGVPVSGRVARCRQCQLSPYRIERAASTARRIRAGRGAVSKARSRRDEAAGDAGGHAEANVNAAFPAARRSATRCCRWRSCGRAWRSSTRPTAGSTSMR